jgi:hypothetical protein
VIAAASASPFQRAVSARHFPHTTFRTAAPAAPASKGVATSRSTTRILVELRREFSFEPRPAFEAAAQRQLTGWRRSVLPLVDALPS